MLLSILCTSELTKAFCCDIRISKVNFKLTFVITVWTAAEDQLNYWL